MCSNKKWLLIEVYREVFSGQSPWWHHGETVEKATANTCCLMAFPSTSHSCAHPPLNIKENPGLLPLCLCLRWCQLYLWREWGGRQNAHVGNLSSLRMCVWTSVNVSCLLLFLKSVKTCVKVLHRLWEKINPQPELPTKLPFSRDGTCQSPYWVARTWGPPASRRHRGWRGAVSLLVKQPCARP